MICSRWRKWNGYPTSRPRGSPTPSDRVRRWKNSLRFYDIWQKVVMMGGGGVLIWTRTGGEIEPAAVLGAQKNWGAVERSSPRGCLAPSGRVSGWRLFRALEGGHGSGLARKADGLKDSRQLPAKSRTGFPAQHPADGMIHFPTRRF